MEPFFEILEEPLVPINCCMCPLGVAILRYSSLLTAINRYQAPLIAIHCQSQDRECPD